MVFSALALFLMVADRRFSIAVPVRSALATSLYPMQWLVLQPVKAANEAGSYFASLKGAQASEAVALKKLSLQSEHALQVEQLRLENQRLRELLAMRERVLAPSIGAQVLYAAADAYSRRVVIDRGETHGVVPGSPVIDDNGVLGQVTRVYPLMSEVTLLIDSGQAIPVLNVRTGVRSVAFGQTGPEGEGLELRYTLANADVQKGDLLTTTGVDGVFPPGLPVAVVKDMGPRAEASFNRITCAPLARMQGALHVLVLTPVGLDLPPSPLVKAPAKSPSPTTGRASP